MQLHGCTNLCARHRMASNKMCNEYNWIDWFLCIKAHRKCKLGQSFSTGWGRFTSIRYIYIFEINNMQNIFACCGSGRVYFLFTFPTDYYRMVAEAFCYPSLSVISKKKNSFDIRAEFEIRHTQPKQETRKQQPSSTNLECISNINILMANRMGSGLVAAAFYNNRKCVQTD